MSSLKKDIVSACGPFRRILVAVDADGLASNAVLRGALLARALDAKVELVHAVDLASGSWFRRHERELETVRAQAMALARARTITNLPAVEQGVGARIEDLLRVVPGPPAQAILRRIVNSHADLLVLGAHAKRGLLDFGSTARALLSHSEVPVWVQAELVRPIARVLAAVDLSEHSRTALAVADALANRLDAELHVVTCFVPPPFAYAESPDALPVPSYVLEREVEELESDFARWLDDFPWIRARASSVVVRGDPRSEIPRAAEDEDLVVLGTQGRTGLSRFLLGSIAYGVLRRTTMPVLVVPDPGRAWLLDAPEPAGAGARRASELLPGRR